MFKKLIFNIFIFAVTFLSSCFIADTTDNSDGAIDNVDSRMIVTKTSPYKLELHSYWLGNQTPMPSAGPVTMSAVSDPANPGWTIQSDPLYTSLWDGSPWSCLRARIYTDTNRTDLPKIEIILQSFWRYPGENIAFNEVVTEWKKVNTGWSNPSMEILTSDWNGGPWSCLSVKIRSTKSGNYDSKMRYCRLRIKADWTSNATDGPVISTVNIDGSSNWSDNVITGEWNGAPWSCIRVKLEFSDTNTVQ